MSSDPDGGLERASTLCDLGRYVEAISLLDQILGSDPDNYQGLCLLSLARLGMSNWQGSLNIAHAAMSVDPDSDWAFRLAALALIRMERGDEAVAAAREALRTAPHLSYCYSVLSMALVEQNRALDEARAAADRAVQLAPDLADSYLAICNVACAQGRWDEAEQAVHHALAIDPNSSTAHNELGRIYLRRRRHLVGSGGLAKAAGGFATALRADPTSTVARSNLEIVLQVFLARTAYVIALVAVYGSQFLRDDPSTAARVIPPVLLLIPLWFAVRFVHGLSPQLRRFLTDTLRRPVIASAVALDALAAVALVAAAVVDASGTSALVLAAALLAIAARLLLWWHRRRTIGPVVRRRRRRRRS